MALTSGFMLSDLGVPNNAVGGDGDHYRDTATQNMYFKQSGAWDLVGSLTILAPDGVGTVILQGSGSPLPVNGVAGNYYRNTDNQDLWYKTGSGWELVGTLVATAAEGTVILAGSGAPSNANGLDGNYYRNTDNQDVYLKTSGTWGLIGSWATGGTAGTLIRSGSGAPSNGLGNDGEYYRNEDTEDVYYKDGGAWLLIGNWSGSGAPPFVVGTWSMIGITAPSTPVTAVAGTVGGSAPNWTLSPAPTVPGGPAVYCCAAECGDGVAISGTDTMWAVLTNPSTTLGDSLTAVGIYLINSSATFSDLLTLLNGGIPTNPVWGALVAFMVDGTVSLGLFSNNVMTPGVTIASNAPGDTLYFGYDQATGHVFTQQNAAAAVDGGALNFTGLPPGDTLALGVFEAFAAASAVMSDAPLVFDPSTTLLGKTGFSVIGSAIPPVGASDGEIYEVTAGGTYDGQTPAVGDHVQFLNSLANILVYPSKASVTAAQAAADAAQADAAQALADSAAAQADATQALADSAAAQADATQALADSTAAQADATQALADSAAAQADATQALADSAAVTGAVQAGGWSNLHPEPQPALAGVVLNLGPRVLTKITDLTGVSSILVTADHPDYVQQALIWFGTGGLITGIINIAGKIHVNAATLQGQMLEVIQYAPGGVRVKLLGAETWNTSKQVVASTALTQEIDLEVAYSKLEIDLTALVGHTTFNWAVGSYTTGDMASFLDDVFIVYFTGTSAQTCSFPGVTGNLAVGDRLLCNRRGNILVIKP